MYLKQPYTEVLIVLRTAHDFSRVWLQLLSWGLHMSSYLIGPVADTHGFAELTSFLFISTISICIADLILHSQFSCGPTWWDEICHVCKEICNALAKPCVFLSKLLQCYHFYSRGSTVSSRFLFIQFPPAWFFFIYIFNNQIKRQRIIYVLVLWNAGSYLVWESSKIQMKLKGVKWSSLCSVFLGP